MPSKCCELKGIPIQAHAIRTLTTLPRLMLPRFALFKQLFMAFGVNGMPMEATVAAGVVTAQPR
jgi:hypothetical protein